jgi:hypothetical protein
MLALLVSMTGTVGALPGKNTVDKNDLKPGVVGFKHLKAGAVKENRIATGSITSGHIADNGIDSDDYADESIFVNHLAGEIGRDKLNVPAKGSIAVHGSVSAAGGADATNVDDVTHPATGTYCLKPTAAAGVGTGLAARNLHVTLDFPESSTSATNDVLAVAETQAPDAPGCPAGYWQVRTFTLSETGGVIDVVAADQGFVFVLVYDPTY